MKNPPAVHPSSSPCGGQKVREHTGPAAHMVVQVPQTGICTTSEETTEMSTEITPTAAHARLAAYGAPILAPVGDSPEPETMKSLRAERDIFRESNAANARRGEALWQEKMERQSDVQRITEERDQWIAATQSERADVNAAKAERDDARDTLDDTRARLASTDAELAVVRRLLCEERKGRDKLHEANAEIARLRATHAEAAWERPEWAPRVWHGGDPEPEGVRFVRDHDGVMWGRVGVAWEADWPLRYSEPWPVLARRSYSLTEVSE